jgi:hypothetical protein
MRRCAVALVLAGLLGIGTAGRADAQFLAGCADFTQGTSLTYDDPGEECSDFFILDVAATVIVRLETGNFAGTLGAALVDGETAAASFKRTFVAGGSIDGPVEMTVALAPGNWRLRAFAGVTPPQPCAPSSPVYPGLVPSCNLLPGAAVGSYAVTVRLA